MDSLDFKFVASINGRAVGAANSPQFNSTLHGIFNVLLTNMATPGTGAFADQGYFLGSLVLPPSTGVDIDLVNGQLENLLRDPIEGIDAFSIVRFLAYVHEPTSLASKVRFGGAIPSGGTTGGVFPGGAFGGLLTHHEWSLDFHPGQWNIMGSPTAPGMPIIGEATPNPTTPTQTTILITNLDPQQDAIVSLYVIGEKFSR